MCISTAYQNNEGGPVLAEYVESITQQNGVVILRDIMGKETIVQGTLKSADLTRGKLIIQLSE